MDKQKWSDLENYLNNLHSDYYSEYNDYKMGSNSKIREKAYKKCLDLIGKAERKIFKDADLMNKILGPDATPSDKAFFIDDFTQVDHFSEEMDSVLKTIREEIELE